MSLTLSPPAPSPDLSPEKDHADLFYHVCSTGFFTNMNTIEQRTRFLTDNPLLALSIVTLRPDIAEVMAAMIGKPLTDFLPNDAVPNLSPSPMELSETANAEKININVENVEKQPKISKPNPESEFVYPPERLTTRKGKDQKIVNSVTLKNKFANLEEKTLNDPNITPVINTQKTPIPKTPKIRPIHFTKTENFPDLIKAIAKNVDKNFTYTTNAKFVKIFPNTIYAHTKIVEFLKTSDQTGFFSPIPDYIPLKIIIRGMDINTDLNEIQESLTEIGFKPIKIAQLTSRKSGTLKKLPLFQIQLLDNAHNQNILNLTSLNFRKIKIEPYRSPRKVIQCYNCQQFNHHQENCHLPSRCLRCAEGHKSHECPHITEKLPQPLCCNCGLHHTANYRGCTNFPKPRPLPAPKSTLSSNFSFAQAVKTDLPTKNVAPPTTRPSSSPTGQLSNSPLFEISNVIQEIEQILGVKSLFSLLKSLKHLLNEIKADVSPENRFLLLVQRLPTLFNFAP